jgi:competence protein ComEC
VSGPELPTRVRDLRMLLPALIGWATCCLGVWLRPGIGWLIAIGAGAIVSVAVVWRAGRTPQDSPPRKVPLLAPVALALVVAWVMLAAVSLGEVFREQSAVAERAGSEVSADVSLTQTFTPGMRSVDVTVIAVDGEALRGGGVSARLIGFPFTERVAYASKALVVGYLQEASPWEEAGWVLMARGAAEKITPPGGFLAGVDGLRLGLVEQSLGRPGDGGRLLPGLAIGDTHAVDRGLIEAMRTTSLSHLVAVSGANCAIVVAIVVAIVALFGGGLVPRLVAGTLALVGFVILVTPEPSIVRASIMATIVLVFLASARPVRGIPVLGVTVLLLLAINPWLALDFAFALSVTATGGILLLSAPLTKKLSRVMPTPLALVISLPLAAQIACQPILILLNPVIPVFAVPANMLAAPAAPVATILGMLACVVGGFAPPVAQGLVWLAWWPSAYIAAIGRSLAAFSFATLPWPPGWWGAIAIALLGYLAVAWFLLRSTAHITLRRVLASAWTVVLVLVAGAFVAPRAVIRGSIPDSWSLAQCDVGQGDSLVIRSKGQTAIIDTGEDPVALKRCWDLLGVGQIDVAIITHFDRDHVGGWPALAGRVNEVWLGPATSEGDRDIAQALKLSGTTVVTPRYGHEASLGDYLLRVLWPGDQVLAQPGNDSSLVVSLTGKSECEECLSALFLGDLGEIPQRILAGRETLGPVDVVKVSHHGSADQYEGLYREASARIGLIGVSSDNTYGHPTARALGMLESLGALALRSDERGTLTLGKNAQGDVELWSERPLPQ